MSIQRSLKHDLNAKQIDFYLRRFVEYMSVMDVPGSLLRRAEAVQCTCGIIPEVRLAGRDCDPRTHGARPRSMIIVDQGVKKHQVRMRQTVTPRGREDENVPAPTPSRPLLASRP